MAEQEQVQQEEITQVPYIPRSKARSAGTLLPVNMNTAVQDSLRRLEARVGSIDAFVDSKVNLGEMTVKPFAEQIDSVALAIDNLERGEAFILGDQTGIGKGLQLAEIVKAHMNRTIRMPENVKTLVFVTYDAKLYADFLRDLNDVGLTNVKPLLTNSDFKLTTPSGETLKTQSGKQHAELLQRLAAEGDLGDYNIVFTTYSQLQTVKGEDTARRSFLRSIAKDSLMILDESHNAGGTQNEFASTKATRADFVRELVSRAGGVVFSSATYAKNPYTMTLYASRTGMRHAVEDSSNFVGMVSAGGVPLQQMLAAKLTEQGQYLRRERSYEGIEFGANVVDVDKEVAENMATVMSRIMEFDKLKRSAVKKLHKQAKEEAESVGEDGSTGAAGAKSTNFTSLMHNVINQGLLALKADEAAERCITALRNGEKPVLTLASTMGSFIGRAAEEQDLQVGDPIDLSFGDVLTRYLYRSRDVIIKDAFGNKTSRQLTDDELGIETVEHFEETLGLINSIDWSQMPISPIDYIRQKIEDAGYITGEVTGREDRIRYEGGEQYYDTRSSAERSTAGAVTAVADFNAGNIDVMILNRSGSTGISLHASERFKDQRPRRMIIAQPELDINQFMQMLGRVHRTGQVELPRFELLMGDIPAEKRPGAVLLKKMASLNANTTAARESSFTMGDITDFMNDYGDRVALELMNNNPDLHARLGYPISELNTSEEVNLDIVDTEGVINKVTGRIPLLPLEEQESVYKLLEQEYNELVENERALGNNILEAETLDLDAKPLMRMEVMPKREVGSVFGEAVNLEIMDAKSPRKPLTQLDVTNLVRRNASLDVVEDVSDHDPEELLNQTRAQAAQTVTNLRQQALSYSQRYVAKLEREIREDYSAPEEEEKANDLIATKKQKFQDRINRQFALVSKALRDFPIGQTVRVVGKDGTIYYGVVQEVINKGTGRGNPLTPADWKLRLQLADSARQMTIPLSKLNAERQGIQVEQRDADYDGNDIYELFDIKQTQAREKRQIFTGNVIRAYEKYSGKLVNFTDSNGRVRQGLLMRKGFDIEKELANQPVKLPTVENCGQFFEITQYSGMLKTKEQILTVVAGRDGSVTLSCSKSKDIGGRYYLDENLLRRMPGREFVSVGQEMRVWVPPENAQDVLNYFYESSRGGLLAYSQQEKARELLGMILPKFEEASLEELQTIADEQPPAINEPTTVNELQQTIADLEQSLNASNIAELERSLAAEVDESIIPEAEQLEHEVEQPYGVMTEDGYLLIRDEDGSYTDGSSTFSLEDVQGLGIPLQELSQEDFERLSRQFLDQEGIVPSTVDETQITQLLNQRGTDGQTNLGHVIANEVAETEQELPILPEVVNGRVMDEGEFDDLLAEGNTHSRSPVQQSKPQGFAETFSRNILDQGFVEAAKTALAEKLAQQQEQVEVAEVPEPKVIESELAIAAVDSDGFEVEGTEEIRVSEPEIEPKPVAAELETRALDPREDIVQRFRDRIEEGTRTRITGDDLAQLVMHFVSDVAQLKRQDEIKERCAAELALLEEGFAQRSISSKYIPIYRRALSEAIDNDVIQLDDRNSHIVHIVNWQSRDGKEQGSTQEHFALTYFKYDQREKLRNGAVDTHFQEPEGEEPQVEVVTSTAPVVAAPVVEVIAEVVTPNAEAVVEPATKSAAEVVEPVPITVNVSSQSSQPELEAVTPEKAEAIEVVAPEPEIVAEPVTVEPTEPLPVAEVAESSVTQPDAEVNAIASMGLNPLEVTQQLLEKHDPQTLIALREFAQSKAAQENRYSPSLKEMADWLSSAKELGRSDAYLKRISKLSEEVLVGTDEVFADPENRNPYARNEEFTLSESAYKAMRRDLEESRAVGVAQMARTILAAVGKEDNQKVLFERPNGNYRIVFDKDTSTLTVESKNALRGVILTEVGGVLQQHSITDMDHQIFKAFTEAIRQRTSVQKVAAGQER